MRKTLKKNRRQAVDSRGGMADKGNMTFIKTTLAVILSGATVLAQGHAKPRLFVTDSQSWEMVGGFGGNKNASAGEKRGGAGPQTAEIIKTFGEECEQVTVTTNKDRADYVVLLDHEGGKRPGQRDNKFALFNKDGDAVKSGSTRALGNAVKDACEALLRDWESR